MHARPLTVLTTRLPPQVCGVGTFSWLLDRSWPANNGSHEFLVVDGAGESRSVLNYADIAQFGGDWKLLEPLLDRIGSSDLLLHYTGRGYDRLGCPTGLPRVLRNWKRRHPGARLIAFFHELPGKLPISSRHYLPNLCNKRVVRKLATLADVIITNTTEHARTFEQNLRRTTHYVPVGANVQPAVDVRQERSSTEFVIFGLPYGRWQTLLAFHEYIQKWQANGTLIRLHLIGPFDTKFDGRAAG